MRDASRAVLMYQVESHLGLPAAELAGLTFAGAVRALKRLGHHEALGLARQIATLWRLSGRPQTALLFPSQKGGGPLGRVAVWRLLTEAKAILGVVAADVLRHLRRLARGDDAPSAPTSSTEPWAAALAAMVSGSTGRVVAEAPVSDEDDPGWSGEGDAYG